MNFLMKNTVVPWTQLQALITPHAPTGKTGRPPFAVATMLRIHCMQHWFGLSDPEMEEALHDIPLYRYFAGLDAGISRLPDETTILRFRHLLEANNLSQQMLSSVNAILLAKGLMLKTGTVVDTTLIAAPSFTKNRSGQRDPEMQQTKKGNQWHFGMKAHIGVDADSGLVYTVIGPAANVHDVTQGNALLHGEELAGQAEKLKAGVRAKVEHPFRVIKCQFGYVKVRYKGLAKNTAHLMTLFALSNLWMVRRALLQGVKG